MRSQTEPNTASRLERLISFLDRDPDNCALLGDAALAAFDEHAFAISQKLLDRHRRLTPLPPQLLNLEGLIALAERRYDDAAHVFDTLRELGDDDPALRFNLAWAKANVGDYEAALSLLDNEAVAAAPRGPSLKVHVLHHLNRYPEALACGEELARRFPDNEALFGALATVALDAERPDLAREYARGARNHPEGQTALAYLALGEGEAQSSLELFENSLKAQPASPRALVGKGLSMLMAGQTSAAAHLIQQGAQAFGSHLGSWIAAGWAQFLANDLSAARRSFERARAVDGNFSEAYGGLAVLDLVEGHREVAARNCELALRLDRNSLGGALAKSLLLERSGQTQAAQKIRDIALSAPLGPNGQTIAGALVAFAGRSGSKPH